MIELDLNLIREIVKHLYKPINAEATLLDETYALSPPSIDGYENQ